MLAEVDVAIQKPSQARLTYLALRTLEEALAEAQRAPVKRHYGHRLALAWLAHCEIGLDWHYEKFWTSMADPHCYESNPDFQSYSRTRDLTGLLNHWYYAIGLTPPDPVQRAKWAGTYPAEPVPP